MQKDLDANYPDAGIQILGINQLGHQSGNPTISEGRDLPWLQDADLDQNGSSDVWLNSWPYAYRDVVILDAENRVVETYSLTTNDLRVQEKYDELRQRFLDAAGVSETLPLTGDAAEVPPGGATDVLVLRNDPLADGAVWELQSVEPPATGTAELVTIRYPADLKPQQWPAPPLVISEVRPGEWIELFNGAYAPVDLDDVDSQLLAGSAGRPVSELGAGLQVEARGYVQLDWPLDFPGGTAGGELMLYAAAGGEASDPALVMDFVVWGTPIASSRQALAESAGRWSGDPAAAPTQGSIHRRVGTFGASAADYDTQSAATGELPPDGAVVEVQAIRYSAPDAFTGDVAIRYTAQNGNGTLGTGQLTVHVQPTAHPWRNDADELDVDANGLRAPNDALLVINLLNRGFQGALPMSRLGLLATMPYVDTNGNNSVEPADLLKIINGLIAAASGEGEAAAEPPADTNAGSHGTSPIGLPVDLLAVTATPDTPSGVPLPSRDASDVGRGSSAQRPGNRLPVSRQPPAPGPLRTGPLLPVGELAGAPAQRGFELPAAPGSPRALRSGPPGPQAGGSLRTELLKAVWTELGQAGPSA